MIIQVIKCDINEKFKKNLNSPQSDKKVNYIQKYLSTEKSSKQIIDGTNLKTYTFYCIIDTKDLFLIWDGNVDYVLMTIMTDKCLSV